ncbi:MAG: ferredoxin [Candidatus Aenigmarchaeota archaeon]|nr:ferredoxin [Candidatus Aenigmarchaeota archaeon]
MKVGVNKEKCIGCGACVSVCPDVFEMSDDGKSEVKKKECDLDCCKEAKDVCPVDAISLD